jgi:hypothetical protein
MRIDSNKFHLVRLEVDIFAMKCPARNARSASSRSVGTALDRRGPFT